jgi:hypothetical protein
VRNLPGATPIRHSESRAQQTNPSAPKHGNISDPAQNIVRRKGKDHLGNQLPSVTKALHLFLHSSQLFAGQNFSRSSFLPFRVLLFDRLVNGPPGRSRAIFIYDEAAFLSEPKIQGGRRVSQRAKDSKKENRPT